MTNLTRKLISYLTQNDIENIIVCLTKIIRPNHFNQLSQSVAWLIIYLGDVCSFLNKRNHCSE